MSAAKLTPSRHYKYNNLFATKLKMAHKIVSHIIICVQVGQLSLIRLC